MNQKKHAYRQVFDNFSKVIAQTHPEVLLELIDSQKTLNSKIDSQILLALGPKALNKALQIESVQPIIATMISDHRLIINQPNVKAVLLKTDILAQLKWHKQILPAASKIGILYDPKINQAWVDQAKSVSLKLGLEIIAIKVRSPLDISGALKRLGREADSILGIADKTVYSSKTSKAVLLFSYHNRIPFIGLSGAWVKAGALYALDWDYEIIGQHSAALAIRLVEGEKLADIGTINVSKTQYVLNLKTAKKLKLQFPDTIIENAFKAYN